jgi:UDP-N-acetylglucosamine 1-carboxyvinyltransferase
MDQIRIRGGNVLEGEIPIIGAKNAALPLMTAALLTDETLTLDNVPQLSDIQSLANLLEQHGTQVNIIKHSLGQTLKLSTPTITSTTAPYDLVRKMRASILVLGPLLARSREAYVSLPGGCAIGTRPVDVHIKGLEAMGAKITLEEGYIHAEAKDGLKGAKYLFPVVSVTGTETLLMAAALAEGTTHLENAAREPEVSDLAKCLNTMGAKISGIGTGTLIIEGVPKLHGATHSVLPDRIETGTYAIAAVMTRGDVLLQNTNIDLIPISSSLLAQSGVQIHAEGENGIRVNAKACVPKALDVKTEPFPGFATDLQAQWMALLSVSEGAAMVTETIFENRFMHVPELVRMGADITVNGSSAVIRGGQKLKGAPVMATDLRASVSLVLAGLVAEGETTISRVYHLDRGYERLEEKLNACGADIERVA